MSELVFVKLGGSLITDKHQPCTARPEVIRRCACEIAAALRERSDLRLLLAHGSGSFGHFAAIESKFGSGGATGYTHTGAAAARLNRIVADACLDEGLPVVSIQPSASAVCRDGKLIELATRPVELALEHRLAPLLYGDVAFDLTRGATIASTEMLFDFLARRIQPARILLVGQVDGVFSADPLREPPAVRIARITPSSLEALRGQLGGSHGVDVTGGMLSKVELMVILVFDVPTIRVQILSGEHEGQLRAALLTEHQAVGTWITADA
ncbi:MAG: uridylate kinase [Chloroflexi bacterium]|nr:uridylate kinase [Chloroflexota bacterium]